MLSRHHSWMKPASSLSCRARTMPKSSHWKKRPCEVGKTSKGSPDTPKCRVSITRPNDGLHWRRYSRTSRSLGDAKSTVAGTLLGGASGEQSDEGGGKPPRGADPDSPLRRVARFDPGQRHLHLRSHHPLPLPRAGRRIVHRFPWASRGQL